MVFALSPEGVALAVAAALYLSWCSGPRGRVCRPNAAPQARFQTVALRGWDRTRPYGRRSYALCGTLPYGGEPGSRQPEQYASDRGTSQIPPEHQPNPA